jgi:nucleoside triphosphate diphosphatase
MSLDRLISIMRKLRDPVSGCEWDSVQTFKSIAPYTIEEAYEVADAIERNDIADLKDELGDLLLQVVFHSQMAEEAGHFDINEVASAISDKMERRHPHIFGSAADGGHHLWEQVKADERAAKGAESALDGVAAGLPSLMRAEKLQKRAARTGFDWPNAEGPRAKIVEELAEIDAESDQSRQEEELGDLLFAVANLSRHLKIDPEEALRKANRKFERRFRAIERHPGFEQLSLDEKEALWWRAKVDQADSSA